MSQLWHILKKDCRYLRFEFLAYALVLGWYAWDQTHAPVVALKGGDPTLNESLPLLSVGGLIFVATYLIARLIHAEAIPGDNQFWLTRPYSWKSLLGAKIMLLLFGVSLPMLAIRLVTFRLQGLPDYPEVWQLLWSQLVMTVVIALPIAALAALTSGIVQFVISALVLIPVAAFVEEDAYWANHWPAGTLWFRETLAAAGLIAIAVYVLHSQYRNRRTAFARGLAICAFAAIGILFFFTPWSLATTVNGWLTAPMTADSSPSVAIGPQLKFFPQESGDHVNGRLPVSIRGIPSGYSAELQEILVIFRGPEGVERQWFATGPPEIRPEGTNYRAMGALQRSFFEAAQGRPMTIRVSLDVILFPPGQTETVPLSEKFVNLVGGVQCRGTLLNPEMMRQLPGRFDGLECRPAFDWPEIRIMTSYLQLGPNFPTLPPSHSPFYTGALTLAHLSRKVYFYRGVQDFSITTQGPPRWYHRDFEFRNVRFGDTMDLH